MPETIRTCPHCQRDFAPTRPWSRFCCSACRQGGYRNRLRGCVTRWEVKSMVTHTNQTERLLTRPEVAELLGCSPASVRRLEMDAAANFPQAVRVSAGMVRWRLSDLQKFLAALKPAVESHEHANVAVKQLIPLNAPESTLTR